MRIAFFMAPLLNHGGGAEKFFIEVSNEMSKRGHKVSIINLDKSFYNKLSFILSIYYRGRFHYHSKLKYRYTDKQIKKGLKGIEWIKINLRNLKKVLQDFDVIYVKNEILDLGVLKLIRFSKLLPIIVGVHTPIYYSIVNSFQDKFHNFLYLGPFYKWLLKDCASIHIPNSDDELFVKKHFSRLRGKIFKIFYPFDCNIFKPSEIKRRDNKFRILFVGRLTEQKGVDVLVKIIKRLSAISIFKDLHFAIAGSGELDKEIGRLTGKFRNINYLGHVSQEKMSQIYSSNDILIAPSRYEMLPWVSLEAQSYGLPVIVSDIPGPRDIIISGETGFLVENKPENFIDKIEYLCTLKRESLERFSEFCRKAREHIQEKFEPTKIYNQLENMFEVVSNAKK